MTGVWDAPSVRSHVRCQNVWGEMSDNEAVQEYGR